MGLLNAIDQGKRSGRTYDNTELKSTAPALQGNRCCPTRNIRECRAHRGAAARGHAPRFVHTSMVLGRKPFEQQLKQAHAQRKRMSRPCCRWVLQACPPALALLVLYGTAVCWVRCSHCVTRTLKQSGITAHDPRQYPSQDWRCRRPVTPDECAASQLICGWAWQAAG